uniref:Uncharacterized protein n=1 Tax=Plectus sambesii TaxID=2011161 RepID=A0A914VK10_9BILA
MSQSSERDRDAEAAKWFQWRREEDQKCAPARARVKKCPRVERTQNVQHRSVDDDDAAAAAWPWSAARLRLIGRTDICADKTSTRRPAAVSGGRARRPATGQSLPGPRSAHSANRDVHENPLQSRAQVNTTSRPHCPFAFHRPPTAIDFMSNT